jgi:hypothetical protein
MLLQLGRGSFAFHFGELIRKKVLSGCTRLSQATPGFREHLNRWPRKAKSQVTFVIVILATR